MVYWHRLSEDEANIYRQVTKRNLFLKWDYYYFSVQSIIIVIMILFYRCLLSTSTYSHRQEFIVPCMEQGRHSLSKNNLKFLKNHSKADLKSQRWVLTYTRSSLSEQLGTGALCKIKLEELHILKANNPRKGHKLKWMERVGNESRRGANPLTAIKSILGLKWWLTDSSEGLSQIVNINTLTFCNLLPRIFLHRSKAAAPFFP